MNTIDFETRQRAAISEWEAVSQSNSIPTIFLGTASCGRAAGALEVLAAIQSTLADLNLQANVVQVGCIGPCYLEPLMDIALPGLPRISYANVNPEKGVRILTSALRDGDIQPRMAKGHFGGKEFTDQTGIPRFFDLPMLKSQERIILKNCGLIDPENLNHYIARDGYSAFYKVLLRGADFAIQELKDSGLRGRGGAGFPTYKKWEICRATHGTQKYVVCNADEGDPGAFMNRALIESDPHAVLEGMLIAGYTIGAQQGIVYVRAEYPLAVQRLKRAINRMKDAGLLGKQILGSNFDFDIRVKEGAGAFVCGEETALIASLEGQRGTPKPRPPFPADKGFNGRPTLINNTETFGTIPHILRNGGKWFQSFGTPGNAGTKTFSLVGKVRNTGLIEIPLGTTLRQVIYDIGGGTRHPFKAIQTGGPLGGCLPPEMLDTPITYETMRDLGSIMGSGGLIVMDESTCIVDMARFFIKFAESESCGNCTSCRIGTRILLDTLEKIVRGEGDAGDIDILRSASQTMTRTSLCGLGQAASNPITSSLRYFLSEYKTHIQEKFCPAGACDDLYQYYIDPERCTGCTLCVPVCSSNAITGKKKEPHILDADKCAQCHSCVRVCARGAILSIPIPVEKRELLSEAVQ